MPNESPNSASLQDKSLLGLVLVVTVLFAVVLWPMAGAVSWAVFIAIVFSSLQDKSVQMLHGRRGWAALATLAVIVVSVLLPLALLSVAVAHEAAAFYAHLKSGDIQLAEYFQRMLAVLPEWARGWLAGIGIEDLPALQRKLAEALARSGNAVTQRVFLIGQGTLAFVVEFFVMLYLLFFLLRDGRALAATAERAMPLAPAHTHRVMNEFATVVRATVKGNIVVALVQGALGWLAFWFLGIGGALLWGAVMALLSLLPAVGAALVWGPVAVYLLTTGSVWSGVGLIVWGTLVIGLVDNVLRPILVGKDTRMPDWLVLVTTLGGLAVFGLNGFVIGPVIAAVFIATWDIFSQGKRATKPTK
jgi:predicted PurR-regulated permease PerM